MKYKIGDTVRIKKCEVGEWYGGWKFYDEMKKYIRKEAKIVKIFGTFYDLDIDNGDFGWTDEMLEIVQKIEKTDRIIQILPPYTNKFKVYCMLGLSENGNLYIKQCGTPKNDFCGQWKLVCKSPIIKQFDK